MQDTWLEGYEPEKHSCQFPLHQLVGQVMSMVSVGFSWLQGVFDKETKDMARRSWRMLFLDGHGSHLNLTFLEWCLQHKILVACYPPHSTHRLQPLDVGCFAPLASYYSQGLYCHLAAFNELRQRLISRRRRTLTALLEVALEKLRLSLQLSNVVWRR